MDCPRCQSQNTTTFAMAYNAGTSHGSVAGSGYSYDNNLGVHSFSGNTFQQSNLAAQTAPPQGPSNAQKLAVYFGSFVVIWIGSLFVFSIPLMLLQQIVPDTFFGLLIFTSCITALLGALIAAYFAMNFLLKGAYKRQQQDMITWNASWICLRCGTTFLE